MYAHCAWAAIVMPSLAAAIALTFTRSAWVGVAAGVTVLFVLKDRRLLALLPILAVLFVVLAPARINAPHVLDVRHARSDHPRPRRDAAGKAAR